MQGLDLCSILLGCKSQESGSSGSVGSPSMRLLQGVDLPQPLAASSLSTSSLSSQIRSPIAGINFVQFDASANRSSSKKAELAKISKEFDFEQVESECEGRTRDNLFDNLLDDE